MKSIKRIRKAQPPHRKAVYEFMVGGRIGAWFHNRGWGAFTLGLLFISIILFWSGEKEPEEDPNPFVRVHEWVHVRQGESSTFFFMSWAKYLWAMWRAMPLLAWRAGVNTLGEVFYMAYHGNKYEIEAYEVEERASIEGLPDWAK